MFLALVLAGVAPTTVFGAPAFAVNARYQQVLDIVSTGDLALRRRFAEVALRELIEANQAEIARAGSTQSERRWQASAAQFVTRLERIFERLERVQEITVVQETHGVVRMALDTDQVMLSVPRRSQQDRFDRALATFLCHEVSCSQAAPELADMVHTNARAVAREWLFSDQAPPLMMAADGLNCSFSDTRHLRLKESACEGVMQELRLVAASLRAVTSRVARWIGTRLPYTTVRSTRRCASPTTAKAHISISNFTIWCRLPRFGMKPFPGCRQGCGGMLGIS